MISRSLGAFAAVLACALSVVIGAAGVSLGTLPRAAVAAEPAREYLIKAAFVYNFAKFTEWPAAALPDDSAVRICVLGEDPFGPALQTIDGKSIKGRALVVQRIAAAEDAPGCHVVFVSASEQERLAGILQALGGQPILTIADIPDFTRAGGIITLKTNKQQQVRFEINVAVAKRAGLRLSARLLNLAELTPN